MNDQAKWQAVQAREAAHDGEFVYGVTTTGVYCRPSCPSRRPLRQHVRFYDGPEAAAADGLRPCKRCRPLESHRADPAVATVLDLCRYIEGRIDAPPSLAELGERAGMSSFQVHRLFKRLLAITPKQYVEALRLGHVKRHLRRSASVTDAIYDAGLGSSSRLYEHVDSRLGMTPKQYRRGGEGIAISYATGATPLGLAMIGATDRGICFLQFGDDEAQLLQQLRKEYPGASIAAMDAAAQAQFDAWMRALNAHLEGHSLATELPLDVRGTAFQKRVWSYLQTIPYGDVVSYAEVARAIGAPAATRAVAGACAHNRIGVLIPCHRVIRGDGGLGGYRWGLPRKRSLIDLERRTREQPGH